MKRGRAFRRYQYEVRKEKWRRKFYTFGAEESKWFLTDKSIGMLACTSCRCSCWMCRNKRQGGGKTLQELRFEIDDEW